MCGFRKEVLSGARAVILILLSWLPGQIQAGEIDLSVEQWQLLEYHGIPGHALSQAGDRLHIAVKRSASPVVQAFSTPLQATRLHIRAYIDGSVDLAGLPNGVVQGNQSFDDFRLRVGIIYEGNTTLDPFQLSIAPAWVRYLYRIVPEGTGIDHVEFLNSWTDHRLAGQQRQHPATPLWRERFLLETDPSGKINQTVMLEHDAQILGVWISSDGDDTGSCFNVYIEELTFL